jgi:hypothetical protein
MKSIYLLSAFMLLVGSIHAQKLYFFDKKFKKVTDLDKASYLAQAIGSEQPHKIWILPNYVLYAEGYVYPADTLCFDGKVLFYDKFKNVKAMRFYNEGKQLPFVWLNADLTKMTETDKSFVHYMTVNDSGEFCAFKRKRAFPTENNDVMVAMGKVLDTTSLKLNGIIYYYNDKGEIKDVKNFDKGIEKRFVATTGDLKEPYEILKIVSHVAYNFESVDVELDVFKRKCIETGADGVVWVHTNVAITPSTEQSNGYTYLTITGTTVKLKNKVGNE